jgi:hypothetical protein
VREVTCPARARNAAELVRGGMVFLVPFAALGFELGACSHSSHAPALCALRALNVVPWTGSFCSFARDPDGPHLSHSWDYSCVLPWLLFFLRWGASH